MTNVMPPRKTPSLPHAHSHLHTHTHTHTNEPSIYFPYSTTTLIRPSQPAPRRRSCAQRFAPKRKQATPRFVWVVCGRPDKTPCSYHRRVSCKRQPPSLPFGTLLSVKAASVPPPFRVPQQQPEQPKHYKMTRLRHHFANNTPTVLSYPGGCPSGAAAGTGCTHAVDFAAAAAAAAAVVDPEPHPFIPSPGKPGAAATWCCCCCCW